MATDEKDLAQQPAGSTEQTAADSSRGRARADSTDRDAIRQSRSLVRDLPVGAPKPANQR
jgi:hypothetical protein